MNKFSTVFLRIVIVIVGLAVLSLCVFAFPYIGEGWTAEFPQEPKSGYLVMASLYAAAIPFFLALYFGLKLLSYIDMNKVFSEYPVRVLQKIMYCAVAMSIALMGYMPAAFHFAEIDDAPGLIIFAFAFACVPLVVAVFATILKKLLQNAIDFKNENDLTV
ncbi:MAG: DUF2975 domain-containing protein [Bacteroidota bacterium]